METLHVVVTVILCVLFAIAVVWFFGFGSNSKDPYQLPPNWKPPEQK